MATQPSTALISHGEVDVGPTETYGQGKLILRIGNGGAGAIGLIRALAEDYLTTRFSGSITWTCNHSRNTQLALLYDHIDIALTYERSQEELAASEGWSITAGCLFHDHFVIAGPISDPAGVRRAENVFEGLRLIAKARCLFHSREDASATMWKERELWSRAGLEPWKNDSSSAWYKTFLETPVEALESADAVGAYLVIDRATLLRQTGLKNINRTTVFFEPQSKDDILMNSCYALHAPHATGEKARIVKDFLEYTRSARGQRIISEFGSNQVGVPLFATLDEGFAQSKLAGGRPIHGKWNLPSKL